MKLLERIFKNCDKGNKVSISLLDGFWWEWEGVGKESLEGAGQREFDQSPMSIWATQVVLGYFLFFLGGGSGGRAQESEGRPGRNRKSVSV